MRADISEQFEESLFDRVENSKGSNGEKRTAPAVFFLFEKPCGKTLPLYFPAECGIISKNRQFTGAF